MTKQRITGGRDGVVEERRANVPVTTPDAVPLASTGHPAVLGVWLVEKLAGERDDSVCWEPSCDPGAFRAGGRVVDDGTAAVGRRCDRPGALLGDLLRLAIRVPREWVGLVIRVARVVGRAGVVWGEGATL